MNFFLLVLFYCFAVSIIFTYGIGLERLFIYSKGPKNVFILVLKNLLSSIIAISVLWFFNCFVLLPLGISFFLPILGLMLLLALNYLYELVFPKFVISYKEEVIFEYAPLFVVFFVAVSFIEALAILIAAQIGILILSFTMNAIKEKIDDGNASKEWKSAPLILISMGFLLSGFYFIL